jgi:hypothetical protein
MLYIYDVYVNQKENQMNQAMKTKMQKLVSLFPKVWFKDGSEFSNEHANTIWTGEGSWVTPNRQYLDSFEPSAFDYYFYSETMGVHPVLNKALDDLGLFAEFYDAGTVFIYNK